jgi:hypothetical protein
MEKGKYKTEIKVLIIALSALVAIILILIAVIIKLSLDNKNSHPPLSDDNLAKECLEGDNEQWMDCLDDKASGYLEERDCEKALKVYEDVPPDWFDKYTLADLYDEAYSLSLSCDDLSLREYWEKKFNNLSKELEGMN